MPELPSGTVAFLFTDIEGSTRRWEQDSAAMRAVVERHFAILDAAIEANQGVRYKTIGDAVQAAFPTAACAVSAAVLAQLALVGEPWGDLGPLRVRMAIHVGDAEPHHGDYLAPALNRLARLLSVGHGGQILLTTATADLVRDALPRDVSLRNLGEHRLRDLQRQESVFQVLHPALPTDFPALKSLDVPRHNLPLTATPFIGRAAEVERIVSLLAEPDVRLVTIIGPGGVGKTRLALKAAESLIADYAHGVWFVDLSPLDEPAFLLPAIARTLDVHEEPGRALLDVLREQLAGRSLILVLDNVEQLLAAAPVVSQLLSAIPGLKVLATSRSPLRLRGEREIELAPLSLPEPTTLTSGNIDTIIQSEAVQLFLARATSVKPGFALTNENASAVAEICRRLDGLPLAIELAAARVRILPPRDLLNRLDDRLRLLTGGPRDAPTRHQTLRQAIAWSHDLLDPDEQSLLRRIAIFAGHPTLSAIEEVTDPDGSLDALNGLTSLVEKSLIQSVTSDTDEPRFAMLQNIRAFGLEQLAAQGETDDLAVAHAHYYARLATEANTKLFGAEQRAWLTRLEADHDDLRGSLRRLVALEEVDKALRFAGVLLTFWLIRGYPSEGSQLLTEVLQHAEGAEAGAHSHALASAGMLAGAQGDASTAQELLRQALSLAQRSGNDEDIARVLAALAVNAEDLGDYAEAATLHDDALALYRKLDDQHAIAQELTSLGILAAATGDAHCASALLTEATALFRQLGDAWGLGLAILNRGRLAFLEGDLAAASELSDEALAIFRDLDDSANVALLLANLGEVAFHQGDSTRAGDCYDEALALFRELGDKRNIAATMVTQAELLLARQDLAAAAEVLHQGLTLAREVDDLEGLARGLEVLADVHLAENRALLAVQSIAASDALRAAMGVTLPAIYRAAHQRMVDQAQAVLGDDVVHAVLATGQSLSAEEAISSVPWLAPRGSNPAG